MKHSIVGFSFGDPKDIKSWSGINYFFYSALKKHCNVIDVINSKCSLPSIEKRMRGVHYDPDYVIKYFLTCAKKCQKRLEQIQKHYDLIFQMGMSPAIQHRTPFVIYLDRTHAQWFREYGSYPFDYRAPRSDKMQKKEFLAIEKSMYRGAAKIFTFSNYARTSLIDDYRIDPKKVVTVGGGPNIYHLPKVDNRLYDGNTILFIGNDFQRKGGYTLLEAFVKVRKKLAYAHLVIVSSQSNVTRVTKPLEKSGISVMGFTDKRTLGLLFRKASVFVMPSLYEAYGIAFLEAMAHKVPCIGTNVGAMPEIIEEGKTGFLVPRGNAKSLAEKIEFLLTHKEIAKKMGQRGYEKILKYYTWDKVVSRMAACFDTLF